MIDGTGTITDATTLVQRCANDAKLLPARMLLADGRSCTGGEAVQMVAGTTQDMARPAACSSRFMVKVRAFMRDLLAAQNWLNALM